MVDKNLFLYDLAVVTIMKNEAPYVKEWLDYHLLAGVDHFYIYDNESPDNLTEVLQPYIDAGIVTYTFYPGKCRLIESYIDAVKQYKYFCRYMALIDADEFIFPKDNRSIVEVLDEIFALNPMAGGALFNWHCFGSNGEEKADLSRGVLERFTRRAENDWYEAPNPAPDGFKNWIGNIHVKSILNPRKVTCIESPHYANYFTGVNTVDEDGQPVRPHFLKFPITEKRMVVNHYWTKSLEEFVKRRPDNKFFDKFDRNEVFDDGILKYRDARKSALIPKGGGMESLIPYKPIDYPRLFNTLSQNVVTALLNVMPREFFNNKVENFLTCLNLTSYLKGKIFDDNGAKIFEEMSLMALYKSLFAEGQIADVELLLKEMPYILTKPYPVVKEISKTLIDMLPQIMLVFRMQNAWQQFTDLEHELEMLKNFQAVTDK